MTQIFGSFFLSNLIISIICLRLVNERLVNEESIIQANMPTDARDYQDEAFDHKGGRRKTRKRHKYRV